MLRRACPAARLCRGGPVISSAIIPPGGIATVPQFGRVEYESVYRGVDLVYYGNQGQLEYDFRVAPGADPDQIALSFQGASARILEGDSGDLVLNDRLGGSSLPRASRLSAR